MNVDQLINLLVTITLIEMMVAIGLGVTVADLMGVVRNGPLIARAALANYICVPAVTIVLIRLFNPHPMIAVGFLILAVCPGAPYGPPFTAIAKGNTATSVGLMVLLAGSSALLAPLLLSALVLMVPGSDSLKIDATKIVCVLLLTQLLPLCAGVAIRHWRPHWAEKLQTPANMVSKLLNLAAMAVILASKYSLLSEIRLRGFIGMFILLIASCLAGWLLGRSADNTRKAMAVTTALRNVSVGLVIASGDFPGTPVVTAVVAYGLLSLLAHLRLRNTWVQSRHHAPRDGFPVANLARDWGGNGATATQGLATLATVGVAVAEPKRRHGRGVA
jgi:BASS family bile acid:Na+ symporter